MFRFVLFQFVFSIAMTKQISSSKTDRSIVRSKNVSSWSDYGGIPIFSVQRFVSITSTALPRSMASKHKRMSLLRYYIVYCVGKTLASWSNETIVLVPLQVPACHFTSVGLIEMKEVGLSSVSMTSNPPFPLLWISQGRNENQSKTSWKFHHLENWFYLANASWQPSRPHWNGL